MRRILLSPADVLAAYDAVSDLYPQVPPLIIWRAWEYAAYQRYHLDEPVLDVGCGDGRFFRLVWPRVCDVVGVEMDQGIADAARRSGVYKNVLTTPADRLSVPLSSFSSAFANCSLEHMDNLTGVLTSIHESLRPGSPFVLSVVTDKVIEWASLPLFIEHTGDPARARKLQAEYEAYHHLVNPLAPEVWVAHLERAGFEVIEHIPVLPEMSTRLFLLLDHLWHVPTATGELGSVLQRYLEGVPQGSQAFAHIFEGVLRMERDWHTGSGAIFHAVKRADCVGTAGDISQPNRLPEAILADDRADPSLRCWCGNVRLLEFSPDYMRCSACETLFRTRAPDPDLTRVGERNWSSHHEGEIEHSVDQSRTDLNDRCVRWLRAVVKHVLPPARVLEVGACRGVFTAFLRHAGFDAIGLGPGFSIAGPVEDPALAPSSLDVITILNVIEHLQDPATTIHHFLHLLKPEGILVVQTPRYPESATYAQLVERQDAILSTLRAQQHLHLFSETSIRMFFKSLGAEHLVFEPTVSAQDDMCCVVSRQPLAWHSREVMAEALSKTPDGRFIQALSDLADRTLGLKQRMAEVQAALPHLRQQFEASEADRAARLEVIEEQGRRLAEVESQHRTATRVLSEIPHTFAYRVLRRIGRWREIARAIDQVARDDSTLRPTASTASKNRDKVDPNTDFEVCYAKIREPKKRGAISYSSGSEDRIAERLQALGFRVRDYVVDIAAYRRYFGEARYRLDFPEYYSTNLPEKSLEHYISATLLRLGETDDYIDIASEHSPVPEIYRRVFGARTYRQDIAYPPGLNGDTIGGDAATMPVPDRFASKMALHCSLEHFEGDSDIRFIREAARVLRPGGALCIIPLYVYEEYAIQTDPTVAVAQRVPFEDDAVLYCAAGWANRHGRFYDPDHLASRLRDAVPHLTLDIFRLCNVDRVDPCCYVRFAMLVAVPAGTATSAR